MKLKPRLFIIIVIVLLMSGFFLYKYIADISALEKIDITVDSIQMKELQLKYCKLKLNINILNPTNEDISELSAEFNIFIANMKVGNGSFSAVTIPANDQVKRVIIIESYYADVGNAVIETIQRGTFELTINGIAKGNILFNLIFITKQFNSSYSFPDIIIICILLLFNICKDTASKIRYSPAAAWLSSESLNIISCN